MNTHALPVIVRIGKAGITDTIIAEIKKQIRKRQVIKVKFLPVQASGKDKKAFARELAERSGTQLVAQVGFVAVLKKITP
jgi:RNA-binding protein YhbY